MATDAPRARERHVGVAAPAREVKRRAGPTAWAVLEDVALDASLDDAGRLVATTSSRRIADNLGMTAGTAARALARLRALGLVSYTRQAGAAGRFGLSAYVLGPVPGLVIVDPADTPAIALPRPVPPRPALLCIDRPRAVDAHVVEAAPPGSEAAPPGSDDAGSTRSSLHDDVIAALAGAVDGGAEERAHSAATQSGPKRGRRATAKPGAAQLSILDANDVSELHHPTRQP